MYQYKEGDKIKWNGVNSSCSLINGQKYTLKMYEENNKLHAEHCENETHWQLVEPKERTIEDVEVEDVVEFSSCTGGKVLEVFKNSFMVEVRGGGILIYSFEMAKRRNGKIKQPEPEKKEVDYKGVVEDIRSLLIKCNILGL